MLIIMRIMIIKIKIEITFKRKREKNRKRGRQKQTQRQTNKQEARRADKETDKQTNRFRQTNETYSHICITPNERMNKHTHKRTRYMHPMMTRVPNDLLSPPKFKGEGHHEGGSSGEYDYAGKRERQCRLF